LTSLKDGQICTLTVPKYILQNFGTFSICHLAFIVDIKNKGFEESGEGWSRWSVAGLGKGMVVFLGKVRLVLFLLLLNYTRGS